MVTFRLESLLISNPGQCDLLAFRRSVVGIALVSVARCHFFIVTGQLFLGLGFVAGCSIRSSKAPLAAAVQVTNIRLAGDGNLRLLLVSRERSSGNGGNEKGEDELDCK